MEGVFYQELHFTSLHFEFSVLNNFDIVCVDGNLLSCWIVFFGSVLAWNSAGQAHALTGQSPSKGLVRAIATTGTVFELSAGMFFANTPSTQLESSCSLTVINSDSMLIQAGSLPANVCSLSWRNLPMLFTRPVAWKKLAVLIQITPNLYENQCCVVC